MVDSTYTSLIATGIVSFEYGLKVPILLGRLVIGYVCVVDDCMTVHSLTHLPFTCVNCVMVESLSHSSIVSFILSFAS
jgi:hypothetical protein